MAKFSKSLLNEIRDRISIATFIGERVALKRAGRNFKGLCPFHGEKTPSFNVNDEKQIYHCFGCGEGGDIFRFVMEFDGIGFTEAVRYLAGRAGVEIPSDVSPAEEAREQEVERKRRYFFRVNEIAREFFHQTLCDSPEAAGAREYLEARGIAKEIWTQHFLGYADKGWESLVGRLGAGNAPLDLAENLGLLKQRSGGGQYDFFRDRIMFPIISPRDDVLGFGGRALEDGDGIAKYVNSPDSPIYHKSNCVYGLNLAATAIRSNDQVVLVEGYMDLIALHQAGIENVVAPLGTAITPEHLKLLSRYTKNFVVVFDGDKAGTAATLRSLPIFIEAGLMPRVVALPDGEDPDTQVRKEGEVAFRGRLSKAPSLIEFFADRTSKKLGQDAAGKSATVSKLIPMLRGMTDPMERRIYVSHIAQRLDLDEPTLTRSIGGGARPTTQVAVKTKKGVTSHSVERELIETMLTHTELIADVLSKVGSSEFEDEWCSGVAGRLESALSETGKIKMGTFIDEIDDAELAAEMRATSMGALSCTDEEAKDFADGCVARIKSRPSHARMVTLNEEIRRAETEGDDVLLMSLLDEKKKLADDMRGIGV
jgi:DNA primase